MRLALFGGTFDPIHRGHLAIASAAADAFALDQVIFAPTGRQPLKSTPPAASYIDRLAMTELACSQAGADPRFTVSKQDAPRADGHPNYTVDLLRRLAQVTPGAKLYVLAGADSFLTLREWQEPEALLRLADWIVVSRPGSPLAEEQLSEPALDSSQRARVHLLTSMHQDISATELRSRLRSGDLCAEWIPTAVAKYIQQHALYADSPTCATDPIKADSAAGETFLKLPPV